MTSFADSPEWYPQKLQLVRNRVLMVRMREEDYRKSSFLDNRMARAYGDGEWEALDTVLAQAHGVHPKPLHYIFHTGHVGSTLLSRLLDEASTALPLREPVPLRMLAHFCDEQKPRETLGAAFDGFLNLWSRAYPHNEAVVLKATSNTARIGARLLEARRHSRAVYLSVAAEPGIATLLSSRQTAIDMTAMADERLRRLKALTKRADIAPPASPGEFAAMSWAVESLTKRTLLLQFPGRIMPLDFEELLGDIGEHLARVLGHFGLEISAVRLDAATRSKTLTRYAKKPRFAFSAERRKQILADTRVSQKDEIVRARDWLENLALRAPQVAALLG